MDGPLWAVVRKLQMTYTGKSPIDPWIKNAKSKRSMGTTSPLTGQSCFETESQAITFFPSCGTPLKECLI